MIHHSSSTHLPAAHFAKLPNMRTKVVKIQLDPGCYTDINIATCLSTINIFIIENMNVMFYQPGITPNRVIDKPVHHVSVVFDLA